MKQDYEGEWDFVLKPFISVKQGSKIIVTTRNESVAGVKSTFPSYLLRELNEDNWWLVFEKHALDGGHPDEHPELKEIGQEIVRKCGGLPLGARAHGSLLRCSHYVKYWEKILKTNIWDPSNDGILPALKLSYLHLAPILKQCFAYWGMFPKGYRYMKEESVLLWIAEGFLGDSSMEEGGDCFDKLVSRSFFSNPGNVMHAYFVMHDLFNELAKSVSGDFSFRMKNDESCQPSERTRHVFNSGGKPSAFKSICKASHLRTLFVTPHTRVRSLSIFRYGGQRFPNWVGDSSFSQMVTLYLKGCENLSTLPPLGSLPSLKDLSIVEFDGVKEIGPEFYGNPVSKMKQFASLEVLWFEQMAMVHEWQVEFNRMQWGGLQLLPSLSSLTSGGCNNVESFPEEMLLPSNLTFLLISDFKDLKSLNYQGIQHLSSVEQLSIWNCHNLLPLPREGLPSSVSYLDIHDCPKLEERCKKERGEDWPKISQIRNIRVN